MSPKGRHPKLQMWVFGRPSSRCHGIIASLTDHAVRPLRLADLLVPYATVRPRGIYPRVASFAGCRSESLDASSAKGRVTLDPRPPRPSGDSPSVSGDSKRVNYELCGGDRVVQAKGDETPTVWLSTFFTSFSCETCRSVEDEHLHVLIGLQGAISPYNSAQALFPSQNNEPPDLSAHFMRQTRTGSCRLVYIFQEKMPFAPFAYQLVFPNVNLRTSVR